MKTVYSPDTLPISERLLAKCLSDNVLLYVNGTTKFEKTNALHILCEVKEADTVADYSNMKSCAKSALITKNSFWQLCLEATFQHTGVVLTKHSVPQYVLIPKCFEHLHDYDVVSLNRDLKNSKPDNDEKSNASPQTQIRNSKHKKAKEWLVSNIFSQCVSVLAEKNDTNKYKINKTFPEDTGAVKFSEKGKSYKENTVEEFLTSINFRHSSLDGEVSDLTLFEDRFKILIGWAFDTSSKLVAVRLFFESPRSDKWYKKPAFIRLKEPIDSKDFSSEADSLAKDLVVFISFFIEHMITECQENTKSTNDQCCFLSL